MSMPGRLLSQPASSTVPSKRSACTTHSTESAMTSRDTSEARIPSWPIEMPSLTAMVTNSSGKPPASFTPSFDRLARRSSGTLQGVTSFQLDAMPTCALPKSASVMPTARSIARAGARSMPSVTSWLRGFILSVMKRKRTPMAVRARHALAASGTFGPVTDVGLVYGSCRERISKLVRELPDDRAALRVAATPEWTVHDVVAHLTGIVGDINAGNLDALGTPAGSAVQVSARQ